MDVIIRADASVAIGSGHVIRCLTVARQLLKRGCRVKFWMEPLEGNLIEYVAEQGFENVGQFEQADLYIVDHYGIDAVWEKKACQYARAMVVIDDLANRLHDCDLLLDQNVVPHYESRYDKLVPTHCVKLLGPKYLMMRDEFIEARQHLRQRTEQVNRLLVFMGGSDPTNETMKVLEALANISFSHVDVVVGNANPQKKEIEVICQDQGYVYHCQIDYMARLMQEADFSIGAGGSTTWERCYVGLPSSATIVADNQREATEYAAQLGAVINLGWHEEVTVQTYKDLLQKIDVGHLSVRGLEMTFTEVPNSWADQMLELIR